VTPNVTRRVPIGFEETEGSNGKTSPDSELARSTLGELYDIVIKLQRPWRASVELQRILVPRELDNLDSDTGCMASCRAWRRLLLWLFYLRSGSLGQCKRSDASNRIV